MLAPQLESVSGAVASLGTAIVAIILGAILEGVLVGAAQEHVLRSRLNRLQPWSWTFATAVGAGLAWLVGMVPSTIMALTATEPSGAAPAEPALIVRLVLALGLGVVGGPILGVAQWIVLRRLVTHPGRWLWANALAWSAGMLVIFAGMDVVPWEGPAVAMVLSVYSVCGATGLIVGAIHGRVLVHVLEMTDRRTAPATEFRGRSRIAG